MRMKLRQTILCGIQRAKKVHTDHLLADILQVFHFRGGGPLEFTAQMGFTSSAVA